jgi:hypothetical protein
VSDGWREPAYLSGCLADVLPSVCDGLRVPSCWDHLGLGEHERVLVLVIDGLGWHQLMDHADVAPTLAEATRRSITTVVPSTTATALTSLGTGEPAGVHGVVGTSFRVGGQILFPLNWRRDIPVALVQQAPTWWARASRAGVSVSVVSPRAYASGGLTEAALSGGAYRGADGPGERVSEIVAAVAEGERALVYGYWEALDRTAHMRGVASPHYRAELAAADRFVQQLLHALPTRVRLVVTADHGVVDCPVVLDLEARRPLAEQVTVVAGEPRLRHVYTVPGAGTAVARIWASELGESAEVVTREEFVGSGRLGEFAPELADRVGDVVVLARDNVRLTAPSRDAVVSSLIGQHGSLTPAEMDVPLAVWDL